MFVKILMRQKWFGRSLAKGLAVATLALLLHAVPAGAQSETAPPIQPAQPIQWERILTCDSGKAWVDVDKSERRRVQVVIRNVDAIRYLNALGVASEGRLGANTEMTFLLQQETGVFSLKDFSLATAQHAYDNKIAVAIGDEYFVKYNENTYAYRDGNGLKLEFVRTGLEICNYYDSRNQTCVDNRTHYVRDRYVGNWFFSDCKN